VNPAISRPVLRAKTLRTILTKTKPSENKTPQNNCRKKPQMKIKINKPSSGFTLIELLVVIAIIAILAAFAVPALNSALKKGQMTGTMNSARQLYIAQFQMSNDGAATGDASSAWPGDLITGGFLTGGAGSMVPYLNILLAKGYLRGGDALKLLNAPGASFGATVTTTNGIDQLSAGTGIASLKVYPVSDADAVSGIFCDSHNYVYNTALLATGQPYGLNGFIVVHKGGDAAIFRAGQATNQNPPWANNVQFQTQVGMMPGDAEGTVGAEVAANVFSQP
jgi:prepilin-type N-terminal cleavage/methylation domain-containing protein